MERLPLIQLACFMYIQIQEPTSRSTITKALSFFENLLNFIMTKKLKQEVDDNLSVYMDEHGPCGLSLTGDIKIYLCHVIKR